MIKLLMALAAVCLSLSAQYQGPLNISRGINYAASSAGTDAYAVTIGPPPTITLAEGLCVTSR